MSFFTQRRVEALERIPVRNAWRMLLYAWDLAAWHGRFQGAAESSTSLLGLLASVLDDATSQLLRRLARAHTPRVASIDGVRGQIDFGASLRRMDFQAGRATCRFSELVLDTLRNRILRSTLHALSQDPRVRHADARSGAHLRARLARLSGAMEGVALVRLSASDFSRLQLGRNDHEYALPLTICELIHRLQLPTESAGDHALVALCRDDVKFERLFEAFVRNFCRIHLPDCTVGSEVLSWHDELACDIAPAMRTDITITENAPPYRRLVIDTKFSTTSLATTQFGGERIKSGNLYQLYAYLRTQEQRGESFRTASGMLLYPKTSRDVDAAMHVQGHHIRVATFDLGAEWGEVEGRLLALVSDGLGLRSPVVGAREPANRAERFSGLL
jgi:5-methylcytosine-specific restriction enzyme subunit McrC